MLYHDNTVDIVMVMVTMKMMMMMMMMILLPCMLMDGHAQKPTK